MFFVNVFLNLVNIGTYDHEKLKALVQKKCKYISE